MTWRRRHALRLEGDPPWGCPDRLASSALFRHGPRRMDGSTLTPDWEALLALRDASGSLPAGPLGTLFGPLLAPPRAADGCTVVGRLAQTLDGRIATLSGSSQWIGGGGDLLHTHPLRALCPALVVGAGTGRSGDPRATPRARTGAHPGGGGVDTHRRLGPAYGGFP